MTAPTTATGTPACKQCHGVLAAGTQFCMYCGAAVQGDPLATAESPVARSNREGSAQAARPAGPPRTAVGPARSPLSTADHPAAGPRPKGRLVVIARSGVDGPSYPLGESTDIGRAEGHVLIEDDAYLSPRHARIVFRQGKPYLWDLGSTNGVYLRLSAVRAMGRGRSPSSEAPRTGAREPGEVAVPLDDQDLILVGQQVLRLEIDRQDHEGPGPASEQGTRVFGSPATPRYARLAQRTVEGVTRDVYYIRKVETVLGRESGDIVFGEDPFLSRRHAAVRVLDGDGAVPGRFALVDLASSNGTFLRIRKEVELVSGDQFRIGQQLFRVDFDTPAFRPAAGTERTG